ncbi:hypothetical protein [Polaromonas sp. CG_9.11]|uniref:hypothetical protein n=1 Tax=Polaromonas sp. CG_9.11 TaxID=2787730 RepID=UPI0005693E9F|nr:hypothetical protein [Polaromonas sp. CG_9.11]MBG6074240.1 hypothetical protein [Polaromonas sp. CG_9.11]
MENPGMRPAGLARLHRQNATHNFKAWMHQPKVLAMSDRRYLFDSFLYLSGMRKQPFLFVNHGMK